MQSKMGKTKKAKETEYPKLMISGETGSVYLVTEYGCGTCVFKTVTDSSGWSLGEVSRSLAHENLEDFNGTIKLSN